MIEIRPGPGPIAPIAGKPKTSPEQFWRDYYRKHDERPEVLKEKIALLNFEKKFREVNAILVGYLTFHSKSATPWMYEALALSIKLNQGKEEDVKKALKYAGDLAIRSRNPNHLVSVADQLLVLGDLDRVGELLDLAADLIPHRGEPLVMSINLARRTKDPKRMAASIDRLLSLGWPGLDDQVRAEARKQADSLAKSLREEGRSGEADALLEGLPASEARDLFVRLTWTGDADLDLAVDEPLGATARYSSPRTVFGGSIVKNGYGSHPEEVYVCPRAFDGEYTIRIETIYNNEANPAVNATLEIITHDGTALERKETKTIGLGKDPQPVKVKLTEGRRKTTLPYVSPNAITGPPPEPKAEPRDPAKKVAAPDANARPAAGAAKR